MPATADYAPGSLAWRVRVGHAATQAESDALLARIVAAGLPGPVASPAGMAHRPTAAPGGSTSSPSIRTPSVDSCSPRTARIWKSARPRVH